MTLIRSTLRLFRPRGWSTTPAPVLRRWPSRRRARTAVLLFTALAVLGNFGFGWLLDYGPPRYRDPEYGKRYSRFLARSREHPGHPVVAVIGSSRVAMGVRPSVLEPLEPHQPLLINLSLAGSGPVMELMTLRRLLADGVKPDAVLFEYWPAFLREDGGYHEDARIDVSRLRPVDVPTVREFYRDPVGTERRMSELRICPMFSHRKPLMNQMCASWMPYCWRTDALFEKIDPWGWLPGREEVTPEQRVHAMEAVGNYYKPLFAQYEVSEVADRALRQAVAECRAANIPVALVYLPESAGFRAFMPPEAVRRADEHLAKVLADLNVPLIDCRGWVPDDDLPDGFHLTQSGAAAYTKKLAPAVISTFPTLNGGSANHR